MVTAVYPSSLVARAIEAYQRFISPYKGFSCAHRAVHGRDSCSQFAKRVAAKRGVLAMFSLLRRRFTECSVAAQVLDYESRESLRQAKKQQQPKSSVFDGCDVPSSGCDCGPADAFHLASAPADCTSGADCASGADCTGADCIGCDF